MMTALEHIVMAMLVVGQLAMLAVSVWLAIRQSRLQEQVTEQRTRIAMMPTHQDLSELSNRLATVEANTARTLMLVDTIHTSLLEK